MSFFLLPLSYANVTRLVLLLSPLLNQFPFLCIFFPAFFISFFFRFFSIYSFYDHETGILSQTSWGCNKKRGLTLYKTNGKRLYRANHEVNTLEKTPTKYPYDRLRKEPLKNRTIKDSNDKIKGRKRILTSFQESRRRQ